MLKTIIITTLSAVLLQSSAMGADSVTFFIKINPRLLCATLATGSVGYLAWKHTQEEEVKEKLIQ